MQPFRRPRRETQFRTERFPIRQPRGRGSGRSARLAGLHRAAEGGDRGDAHGRRLVDAIVRASRTADAPVADAAERLAAAYASAVAAHGQESEPDAIAAVSVAGADMTGVCADSGLDTVG